MRKQLPHQIAERSNRAERSVLELQDELIVRFAGAGGWVTRGPSTDQTAALKFSLEGRFVFETKSRNLHLLKVKPLFNQMSYSRKLNLLSPN